MHETHLVEGIVRKITKEMAANRASKLLGLEIKLGELSEFTRESLQETFTVLTKGTPLEGAVLKTKVIPQSREIQLINMEVE